MIKLCVEDYCHGCRDFEADVHENYAGQIGAFVIQCEHRNKCMALKNYIEKNITPAEASNVKTGPIKSYGLCCTCKYGYDRHCKPRISENADNPCDGCPMSGGSMKPCLCNTVMLGKSCPYYKEAKNEQT